MEVRKAPRGIIHNDASSLALLKYGIRKWLKKSSVK